jgi:Holliday junction resolvase RusA-like endonuclease
MRLTISEIPKSPNSQGGLLRMHWASRHRYNLRWQALVRSAIDNTHKTPKEKQMVTISQMRKRKLDPDNLYASCKPVLDALAAWGLIKDDSSEHIELRCAQVIGKEKITIIDIRPYKPEEEVNA